MPCSCIGNLLRLCSEESMGFDSSEALSQAAKMNTTYNMSTIVFALALVPLALKFGGKKVYVFSLFLTGIAMLSYSIYSRSDPWLFYQWFYLVLVGQQ